MLLLCAFAMHFRILGDNKPLFMLLCGPSSMIASALSFCSLRRRAYAFSGLLEDIQPRRHAAAPPRVSAFPLAALVIVGGVGPPAHLGHSVVEQLAHPEPSMVAALQSASPKAPPLWFTSQDTPPRVIAKTWRRHPQLLPLLLPQSPCRASGPIRRSHLWPWPDALLRSDSRTICCC